MPLNPFDPAVPGEPIAAAYFNEQTIEQFQAIVGGDVPLQAVTFDGDTSDPALSDAGEARVSYNTTINEMRVSKNGGAYEPLGTEPNDANSVLAGRFFS